MSTPPNHDSYEKPNEFEYKEPDVIACIDEHTSIFREDEPLNDEHHQQWLERKHLHDEEVRIAKAGLLKTIKTTWENNNNIEILQLSLPDVMDSNALKSSINCLFKSILTIL